MYRLIFLRFAEARFAKRRAQLEKAGSSSRRGTSRIDDPKAYIAECVLYLTPQLLSAFGDDAVICASFCKRVRPDAAGYGSELLYLSFLEGYESGEIEQFQVQSTGISNFKWTEYIAKTERVIPPEPSRVRFRERVTPLFSQIATLGLQIQNLRRTRDLLLPRLLSGQVGV